MAKNGNNNSVLFKWMPLWRYWCPDLFSLLAWQCATGCSSHLVEHLSSWRAMVEERRLLRQPTKVLLYVTTGLGYVLARRRVGSLCFLSRRQSTLLSRTAPDLVPLASVGCTPVGKAPPSSCAGKQRSVNIQDSSTGGGSLMPRHGQPSVICDSTSQNARKSRRSTCTDYLCERVADAVREGRICGRELSTTHVSVNGWPPYPACRGRSP